MLLTDKVGFTPTPLRKPSPDIAISNNITSTKEVTLTPQKKKPETYKNLKDKKKNKAEEHSAIEENKQKQIENLKKKFKTMYNNQDSVHKEEQNISHSEIERIFQRMAFLEDKNEELQQKLYQSSGLSIYEGELDDIKSYVIDQLTETATKFKTKLDGKLTSLQKRLEKIQNCIDHPHSSSVANVSSVYTVSPLAEVNQTFQASPQKNSQKKGEYFQYQPQSTEMHQRRLQTQLWSYIQKNQQLENDNQAIRLKLRQYQNMLIRIRQQNNKSNVQFSFSDADRMKQNYQQLLRQNEAKADTINSLRRSFNQIASQNNKLKDDLVYSMSEVGNSKKLIQNMKKQTVQLLNAKNGLEKQVFDLRVQLKSAISRPPSLIKNNISLNQSEQYQSSIFFLQKRITELENQNINLISLQQSSPNQPISSSKIRPSHVINNPNLELQNELIQTQDLLQNLTFEHERILRQKQDVQIQLQKMKQGIRETKRQTQRNQDRDKQLTKLEDKYDKLTAEYTLLKENNKNMQQNIVQQQKQSIVLKQKISILQNKVEQLNQQNKKQKHSRLETEQQKLKLQRALKVSEVVNPENFLKQIHNDIKNAKAILAEFSTDQVLKILAENHNKNKLLVKQLVSQTQILADFQHRNCVLSSQIVEKSQQICILTQKNEEMQKLISQYINCETTGETLTMSPLELKQQQGLMSWQINKFENSLNQNKQTISTLRQITSRVQDEIRRIIIQSDPKGLKGQLV